MSGVRGQGSREQVEPELAGGELNQFGPQVGTEEAPKAILALLPTGKRHPLTTKNKSQAVGAIAVAFFHRLQLGRFILVPELEGFE